MIVWFFVLLIVIILSVGLLVVFRKDNTISLKEAKKRNETPNSKYFTFTNQEFHYVEKGQGEVVILIHGIGDSFYVFNKLARLLAQKYQVICIDLPGFGLSEVPSFSDKHNQVIQYYRDFFDAFLTHKNIQEFHLAGNSLGGLVAWDWAVNNTTFNLKSLCLIASAGFDMEKVRKNVSKGILDKLPAFLLMKGAPLNISKLSAVTCIVDKSKITPDFVLAHSSMINKEGTIPFFIQLLFNSYQPQVEKLAKLDVPTLIVWGKKDKIIPVQHASLFEAKIPNSKKVLYDNCGHYPQIEFSEKLAEDWMGFVEEA